MLGPVRALTVLGTVPPDAALATAAAHHKSRRGEVQRSLAAVATKAPAEAWPILSQAGPALSSFHPLYWSRYNPVEGPYVLFKISFVLKVVVGPAASRAASGHGSDRVYTVPTVP